MNQLIKNYNNWQIKEIIPSSNAYLKKLKGIKSPPPKLYFKGTLPAESIFSVAIVGTRRCTDYGKEIAFSMAKNFASLGVIVISGLALGIDSFAHKGALEGGGKTIAVLGTGLDGKSFYPKENLNLAEKILANDGAIISEYSPGSPGFKFNFPKRNRIIVGLSEAVLVVEARLKSGSLITARMAFEEKKKVFAVPGNIYWQTSKGTNWLIKNGATLVNSFDDMVRELGIKKNREIKEYNPQDKKRSAKGNSVINLLEENGPMALDQIIEKLGLPPREISSILSLLEIEGRIKNISGNLFSLSK